MVSSDEEQVIILSKTVVEISQECCQVFIKSEVVVFLLDGIGSISMPYSIRAGKADGKKISKASATEIISFNSRFGKVESDRITMRSGAYGAIVLSLP